MPRTKKQKFKSSGLKKNEEVSIDWVFRKNSHRDFLPVASFLRLRKSYFGDESHFANRVTGIQSARQAPLITLSPFMYMSRLHGANSLLERLHTNLEHSSPLYRSIPEKTQKGTLKKLK